MKMNAAKTLFCCIPLLLVVSSAQAQVATPTIQRVPPQAAAGARIAAINGTSVTIQNTAGAKRTLELTSTVGLKTGQAVGWCEEDCRTLRVMTDYQVRRAGPVSR